MHRISWLSGLSALTLSGACALSVPDPATPSARVLTGVAPEGADSVLVVDAKGQAFSGTLDVSRRFSVTIDSREPVTAFVVSTTGIRVLRVAPAPGAPSTQSLLPSWEGQVSTAQMQTCDCNADGADEDAQGEQNVLEQIDTDGDGTTDLADTDDDGDGTADAEDTDVDGSGADDSSEDLDSDDDGRPDSCDDDDDEDGVRDEDDEDEGDDQDDDGVDDDDDADDDNDGEHDREDDDDDNDGVGDDEDGEEDDDVEDAEDEGETNDTDTDDDNDVDNNDDNDDNEDDNEDDDDDDVN
jgi:hypothetical protein